MARIAYVDHSFHKKTLSNLFLVDMLRSHGHSVDLFWDDSWRGEAEIDLNNILSYDVIILFQCHCKRSNYYYSLMHDNVICIPMLDEFAISMGPTNNFKERLWPFQGSKIISFSTATHAIATSMGISSKYVRYYKEPQQPRDIKDGLHGFSWIRRPDMISWDTIRTLVGDTKFKSFHLHLAPDPGYEILSMPTENEQKHLNITISNWINKRSDLDRILSMANVFFAPRADEGIGQSFLEAFSIGQCVVAPDYGTMNEYIVSGMNGLLYNPKNPKPLDYSDVFELAYNGYRASKIGYDAWCAGQDDLIDYILMKSEGLYHGGYRHEFREDSNPSVRCYLSSLFSALKKFVTIDRAGV
jgi:hypothetical protein